MRQVRCLIMALLVWGGGTLVSADAVITHVALADGVGGSGRSVGRQWEMIAVDFAPSGGGAGDVQVSVQDVRGGVQVVREVGGGGSSGRVWMPLPLVGRATLAHDQWPVEVVVRGGGKELERRRIVLELGTGGSRRGVVPAGQWDQMVGLPFDQLTPIAFAAIPEEEILCGPALAFAGCDLVVLTPDLLGRISEARARELMAAGVLLIAAGDKPPGGALSSLVWQRLEPMAEAGGEVAPAAQAWIAPAVALAGPAVIEPRLPQVVEHLGERAALPGSQVVVVTSLLVGPAALVGVVLVRGLFRRRRTVLLASAIVLAALTAGFAETLWQAGGPRRVELAAWREAKGSGRSAVGGYWLEEHLSLEGTLLGGAFHEQGMWPVVGTEGAYWALRDVQLVLRDGEQGGGMMLRGALPARSRVFLESRTVLSGPLVPALPKKASERVALAQALGVDAAEGGWLEAGRVSPSNVDPGPGVLLDKWAATQPAEVARSLLIWDDLRGQSGHRHFLFAREGLAHLVDYGQP